MELFSPKTNPSILVQKIRFPLARDDDLVDDAFPTLGMRSEVSAALSELGFAGLKRWQNETAYSKSESFHL